MPKRILLDQFHISIYVARRLPSAQADAMSRTLSGVRLRTRLRRAVAAVFGRYRSLRTTSFDVSG